MSDVVLVALSRLPEWFYALPERSEVGDGVVMAGFYPHATVKDTLRVYSLSFGVLRGLSLPDSTGEDHFARFKFSHPTVSGNAQDGWTRSKLVREYHLERVWTEVGEPRWLIVAYMDQREIVLGPLEDAR